MVARIYVDLLFDGEYINESKVGTSFGDGKVEGQLYVWRTLDDDNIEYYRGIGDDVSLEYVFEWSQRDSGTTLLQTMNIATGTWEDCIG